MGGTIDLNHGLPFGVTREQMEISNLRAERATLRAENERLTNLLGLTRGHWQDAQSRLATVEATLIEATGDQTDIFTNIESMRETVARLTANLSTAEGVIVRNETNIAILAEDMDAAQERSVQLYDTLLRTIRAMGGIAEYGLSDAFIHLGVPAEAAALRAERDKLREQLATLQADAMRDAARLEHVELRYGLTCGEIDRERA